MGTPANSTNSPGCFSETLSRARWLLRFASAYEISIREGAKQLAEFAIGFKGVPSHGIVAWKEGELMNGAVRSDQGPTCLAKPFVDL